MKAVNVFLGVLAGAAAGGLVGVLFAPEKGSRTRRQIANKADDYVDDLKEKFEDMVDGVKDKYESIMHDSKAIATKGKGKLKEAVNDTDHVPA
jgi:gas vesicle protein